MATLIRGTPEEQESDLIASFIQLQVIIRYFGVLREPSHLSACVRVRGSEASAVVLATRQPVSDNANLD